MESIKPEKGAVLDDAIAFAAGHLARIAKYPNRVLLVISDGKNIDSHASPLETSCGDQRCRRAHLLHWIGC